MAEDTAGRKTRAGKEIAEALAVVSSLAWNDVVCNGGKMNVKQQEQSMKIKASEWVHLLEKEYSHIPIKPEITEAMLEAQIASDSGAGMIRKAKETIAFINNVLNPYWKEPHAFASGTQLVDALQVDFFTTFL